MNYCFYKESFLKVDRLKEELLKKQNQIYLKYHADTKAWIAPKYSDAKLQLEIERLIQKFHERQWVILKKTKSHTQQRGPCSFREVFSFLVDTSLESSAAIWKKGFSQWKKISEVPEFSQLFAQEINYATSAETADLLESVLIMTPEMRRVDGQNHDKNSGPIDMNEVFIIHD